MIGAVTKPEILIDFSSVQSPAESLEMWIARRRTDNPMFMFWFTVMVLELLMCRFIRFPCEGDFRLCIQMCDELCSWFHAMDYTNFARWLPLHVRDMVQLPRMHPQLYNDFLNMNIVVQKSGRKFSLIGKDLSREQSNKNLQAHGDAVGLYENHEAITLFMPAVVNCTRFIKEV
jgi:hypothetical protein